MSTEADNRPRKPFSMIREFHMADWFTLGNAISGTGALFSSMTYLQSGDIDRIYVACALVLSALIFDILDGRIARWRQKSSAMGRELDSLARRHLVRRCARRACVCGGHAGAVRPRDSRLLRRVRRVASRPLQRDGGGDLRRLGQGEVFRGHADPDLVRAGVHDRRGGLGGRHSRRPVVRRACGSRASRCIRSRCCSRSPGR